MITAKSELVSISSFPTDPYHLFYLLVILFLLKQRVPKHHSPY